MLVLAGLCVALPAVAKDDSPRPYELAQKHPWHASHPSTTKIEAKCGDKKLAFSFSIDDRGWKQIVAAKWSAVQTPFGRFFRSGDGHFEKVDEAAWLVARDGGLSLREIAGAPVLPKSWHLSKSGLNAPNGRIGTIVRVTVFDRSEKKRELSFDTITKVWTLDGSKVLETKLFHRRRLPTVVRIRGCHVTRAVVEAEPKMPLRDELLTRP